MISNRGYSRIASGLRNSGFFDFDQKEEDYNDVYAYLNGAMENLSNAMDVEDAITYEGWQYLTSVAYDLNGFLKNFDQFKIIPLK